MKRILIADDEPEVARALGMNLEAHGYEVMTAVDGLQAVTLAHRGRPDLIILDIKMPGQNGYTVLKNLKICWHTMKIPIIFISGLPVQQVKGRATELGAQDFIAKPLDSKEVVAKIQDILGE